MRDIVMVPLDGSAFAEGALPIAAALVARDGAELLLVHVHQPLLDVPMAHGSSDVPPEVDEALRDDAEALLESAAATLRGEGIPVAVAVLDGAVATTLARHATAVDARLVVMTTHGRGALSRFWLGNVTDQLVRRLCVPVLVVPPARSDDPLPAVPPRRILVSLDRSDLAEAALKPARALAGPDGKLLLVHVVEPLVPIGEPAVAAFTPSAEGSLERMRTDAESYLRGLAQPGADIRVVVEPGVARALIQVAGEWGADAIAIATHGRGGVRRLLLGSVADKVIRASPVPVCVVRPAGAEG